MMMLPPARDDTGPPVRVGVAGIGALGTQVCTRLLKGVAGVELAATAARTAHKRPQSLALAGIPNVTSSELPDLVDVVVECASREAFRDIAVPALRRGRTLVVISSGALLLNLELLETHRCRPGQVVVASGALPGLDGVRAACEGRGVSALLVTRKPASALEGPGASAGHGADAGGIGARCLFRGNALEAVRAFPRNANVAASVALAGVGAGNTKVEIWADPQATKNSHELTVRSDSGTFLVQAWNAPSPSNPRSSLLAAHSLVAALSMVAAERAGRYVRDAEADVARPRHS